MSLVRSICLILFLFTAAPAFAADFPTNGLYIQAQIDGRDELHLSPDKIWWKHLDGAPATDVQINGLKWNPKESPDLVLPKKARWLAPGIELCGAVLHPVGWRGPVKLRSDRDGLVVEFNDSGVGPGTFEAYLDFAHALAQPPADAKPNRLQEWRIEGRIDGREEIWFSYDKFNWLHKENGNPADIRLNGRPWDPLKQPIQKLTKKVSPELFDFQKAHLHRTAARSILTLDYETSGLIICIEDNPAGPALYEFDLRIPPFPKKHLVQIKADVGDMLLGADLKIYRPNEDREATAVLAGQRCFDARGQCCVALAPGKYQFEVQHKPADHQLVSLKTGMLNIKGPTTIDLQAERVEPKFRTPEQSPLALDNLHIRSAWRTGGIEWRPGGNVTVPKLWLSRDQTYRIRALGHAAKTHAALWKEVPPAQIADITFDGTKLHTCSFRWEQGTPQATKKGLVLHFPDSEMEIPAPDRVKFLTNRRFFNRSYWLEFAPGNRCVFQQSGLVLPVELKNEIVLGGALRPIGGQALLKDARYNAVSLWWDICLIDSQNQLIDFGKSTVEWKSELKTRDGKPVKTEALQSPDVDKLGNISQNLVATATCRLGTPQSFTAPLEKWVLFKAPHVHTAAPPYHLWIVHNYLAKAERELRMIQALTRNPLPKYRRRSINWWYADRAIASGEEVTMQVHSFFSSADWFTHPWALAHEMLHTFGYGHTHEMNRVDRNIQELMEQFRWHAADHPEFLPETAVTPG